MENVSGLASGANFAGVIRIEEEKIRSHVGEVVRQTVEQTLNGLLQAEADELCDAKRYDRSPERLDTRAGHYDRKKHPQARCTGDKTGDKTGDRSYSQARTGRVWVCQ